MKKPLDRIYEAYFNDLGREFGEKVRERVHWLLEQAKGETILDIGCSQGLFPILLGREGKDVIGLDLMEEAIEFARKALEKESPDTQRHVDFMAANFMDRDFGEQKFDSVVMGEILEHIADPGRFVNKAKELLIDGGRLLVTVPFGVNDYFDHKRTYYLKDLLEFAEEDLQITEIKFFGKWVGVIYQKGDSLKGNRNFTLNFDLLRQLEETLEHNERVYIKQVLELKNEISNFKKELETQDEKKSDVNQSSAEVTAKKEQEEEIEKLKTILESEKKEKVKLQRQLVEAYQKEEDLLKEYKLNLKRYNSLKNSKLGKLTAKYWKIRKGLSRGK